VLCDCRSQAPVKSEFKILSMGECKVQAREELAVLQTWLLTERILRVLFEKLELLYKSACSNDLDLKDLGRLSE